MISTALLFPVVVALSQQKLETKLTDLKIVSQTPSESDFAKMEETSIGGVVVSSAFVFFPKAASSADEGVMVFAVPQGAVNLKGQFGFPDKWSGNATDVASLLVYLDGDLVREFNASRNLKPTKVDLPLNGAKSLKLVFKGLSAFGDPVMSFLGSKPADSAPAKAETTPSQLGKISLTSPENGERTKEKVTVKWDAVEGAVAYGVEIVLVNSTGKTVPTKFIRAFTVKGNQFEWAYTDDVVSGDYQVSVIAFGKKGVITRFSPSRKFSIDRKSGAKTGNR